MSEKDKINEGMLAVGVTCIIIAALLMIFLPIGLKEGVGLVILLVLGLGLCVGATPTPGGM